MSDREVPESLAFRQLELLVRNLGEELAAFRRRAQSAETRVRALEDAVQNGGDEASLERLKTLEVENAELRARVAYATERTRQLVARVHFLRQQQARTVTPSSGASGASGGGTRQ